MSETTKKNFTEEKCRVCKDKATGWHYGVVTCEGCKGFFKRGILKHPIFVCYYANRCLITPKMRKKCKLCRWKSCLAAGMVFDPKRRTSAKRSIGSLDSSKSEVQAMNETSDSISPEIRGNEMDICYNPSIVNIANLIKISTPATISRCDSLQLLANTDLVRSSINTRAETSLFFLSLLRDCSYQVFDMTDKASDKEYKRATQLIRQNVNVFVGHDAKLEDVWPAFLEKIQFGVKTNLHYVSNMPGIKDLERSELSALVKRRFSFLTILFLQKLYINNEMFVFLHDQIQFSRRLIGKTLGLDVEKKMFRQLNQLKQYDLERNELALLIPYVLTLDKDSGLKNMDLISRINSYFYQSLMNELSLNNRPKDFLPQLLKLFSDIDDLNQILMKVNIMMVEQKTIESK